jgi:ABC-2 type transport system ATP-binding protein
MHVLSLNGVVKRYSGHTAVDNVSFDIPKGCIFGMLGPNGAGKTSLIRIITTITAADEGSILLDGAPLNSHSPSEIGYMPEERGLYKKMKVGEQLMYLAQLKGMSPKEALAAIKHWMDKFEITSWWDKKIQELSKGMQQKIQFISTVVHDPKLIILDEPFSGLDPINTNLIKDEIYQLNQNGTSIIFSTHRMEQVEEICDRIVLFNQGKIVLEGDVSEVKNANKDYKYKIGFDGQLPGNLHDDGNFTIISDGADQVVVQVRPDYNPNHLLRGLIDQGIHITSYEEILPTLNEIFINKVGESNE